MSQLVACPECKKHLQVPDELIGKKVQCPECKHTFTAKAPDEDVPAKTSTTASKPPPTPSKSAAWDADDDKDDDRTKSKSVKKKKRDDDDDDDDDGGDDDRPRRRSKRRSSSRGGNYAPHRGGMLLAFGLIGLLSGIFVFSILAWIMGNSDLQEIRAGRMDPEGEGMTQAGRIMGMIGVILWVVGILLGCGFFVIWFLCVAAIIGGGAAGAGAGGPPRPRPPR